MNCLQVDNYSSISDGTKEETDGHDEPSGTEGNWQGEARFIKVNG